MCCPIFPHKSPVATIAPKESCLGSEEDKRGAASWRRWMKMRREKKGSRRQRRGRLAKGKQRHGRQKRGAITGGKVTVAQLSQGFNGYYAICEVGLNEALVSRKYISHRKISVWPHHDRGAQQLFSSTPVSKMWVTLNALNTWKVAVMTHMKKMLSTLLGLWQNNKRNTYCWKADQAGCSHEGRVEAQCKGNF